MNGFIKLGILLLIVATILGLAGWYVFGWVVLAVMGACFGYGAILDYRKA